MVNLGGLLGMFGSKEFHLNTGHGSTNLPWYADIYTQKFSYFMLHLGGTSVEPWFIFLVRSSPPKIPLARPNEPVTLQKHSKKGMIRYLPTQIWPIDHDIITMSGHWPDITGYNPSNIFAQCNWSKGVTSPNVPQLKLGNVPGYSPIFKTACVTKKYLKDSLHLALKIYSSNIFPWILSVPQRSQFSSSYVFRKLFASQDR